jgi:hypothetical protein
VETMQELRDSAAFLLPSGEEIQSFNKDSIGYTTTTWAVQTVSGHRYDFIDPMQKTTSERFARILEITGLVSRRRLGPNLVGANVIAQQMLFSRVDSRSWPSYAGDSQTYHVAMWALKRFHDEVHVSFPQNSYPCPFNMFFSPDAEPLRTDTIPSEVATAFKRCSTIFKALHPLIKPNVLCHGDFHTGNTPLPSDYIHAALITNFESSSLGDPFFDVVKFSVRLPPGDRRDLFITYLGDREPTEQEAAHFELMDLLFLMVVVRVRFGSAQRWLAEGTGGPSMTKDEMEELCQSKDPLPSFLSMSFGQMVVRDRQLGAIYALHEFLRRTEGDGFQRLLTAVAQPKVSG